MMTATYSPEDNKLRLYPVARLDADTYARVKAAGFKWAPRQELFVAPMWTPEREDLLIELCGEVGDEDTSLVDRAEERAERFEGYSEKRGREAESAKRAVQEIADGIPMGQPILVGHHSEKRARKDAEKIENGMRRAVNLWKTSQYWIDRAEGALAHAKYKELPAVRARRIKKIEADRRRMLREVPGDDAERVDQVPFYCPVCGKCVCREHEEANQKTPHVWVGNKGRGGRWKPLYAITDRLRAHVARWVEHYDNRLAYEKAMLGEQGALHLLEKPKRPQAPPLLNYRADTLQSENEYHRGEVLTYRQVEVTKAQYAKVYKDYRGTRLSLDRSHRFRIASARHLGIKDAEAFSYVAVFLTDSKPHPVPKAPEPEKPAEEMKEAEDMGPGPSRAARLNITPPAEEPEKNDDPDDEFRAMEKSLFAGVQTVSAPQLFATPPDLAQRVIDLAELERGNSILEPSAGTGRLIDAAALSEWEWSGPMVAVEHAYHLAEGLRAKYKPEAVDVRCSDFLSLNGELGTFDRIVMNPPFRNGEDIKHIQHARHMLKDGGRLVAICANGPRQRETLMPEAREWIDLEPGAFKTSGTNVNAAIVIFDD